MSEQRIEKILKAIDSAFGSHANWFDVKEGEMLAEEPDRVSLLVQITPKHNDYLEWEGCMVAGSPQLLVFEQEDGDDPVMILGEDTQADITRESLYACLYWAEATRTIDDAKPKPTHYAVIDDQGDIVTAVKVESFRYAEKICRIQLKGMGGEAKDWTVKGVTVHE